MKRLLSLIILISFAWVNVSQAGLSVPFSDESAKQVEHRKGSSKSSFNEAVAFGANIMELTGKNVSNVGGGDRAALRPEVIEEKKHAAQSIQFVENSMAINQDDPRLALLGQFSGITAVNVPATS